MMYWDVVPWIMQPQSGEEAHCTPTKSCGVSSPSMTIVPWRMGEAAVGSNRCEGLCSDDVIEGVVS